MDDVLRLSGYLGLGSRLKRIADRLHADAAEIHRSHGYPIQPSQFPLLFAILRHGPLTTNEAAELIGVSQPAITRTANTLVETGLLASQTDSGDNRLKYIDLTAKGRSLVNDMNTRLWPAIAQAAESLCNGFNTDFLNHLDAMENAMSEHSLKARVDDLTKGNQPFILEYTDALQPEFEAITREWVESMFTMEENDLKIVQNPRELIVDRGGIILFASTPDLGIVGTCALIDVGEGHFEVTKMGVKEIARGRKIGQFLLDKTLEYAQKKGLKSLFLLTNSKCASAINLYEKTGFIHDSNIMESYGKRYKRADVAMSYTFD